MSAPLPASPHGHPELAVAWVLHGLEPDEAALFAVHLAECPACRRIVAETEEVTTLLGSAVEPVDPPTSLRDRILAEAAPADDGEASLLASVDSKAPSSEGVVPLRRPERGGWIRRTTALLAVAAVLALVVAVGVLIAANRSLAEQRDAAAAEAARGAEVTQVMDAASQPGVPHAVLATPQGEFVGLVVDRGHGPEMLASGLAPNDPDHTYVLWGLAGGTPVGLTAFGMSGSGPVVQSVPSVEAAGPFAGFAVSLEPGHTVPATPTQVVASGRTAG
ncbi:MAG TPA: anti-sigma factor [Actinomycetospora sp.]|uniref:anti-sigma factor domain-containing protein n=1 Tax=Actinomycetospora sp. TaxID=1872135 RepID=UPI002F3E2ACD